MIRAGFLVAGAAGFGVLVGSIAHALNARDLERVSRRRYSPRGWGFLSACALCAGVWLLVAGAVVQSSTLAAIGVLCLASGLVLLVPYWDRIDRDDAGHRSRPLRMDRKVRKSTN